MINFLISKRDLTHAITRVNPALSDFNDVSSFVRLRSLGEGVLNVTAYNPYKLINIDLSVEYVGGSESLFEFSIPDFALSVFKLLSGDTLQISYNPSDTQFTVQSTHDETNTLNMYDPSTFQDYDDNIVEEGFTVDKNSLLTALKLCGSVGEDLSNIKAQSKKAFTAYHLTPNPENLALGSVSAGNGSSLTLVSGIALELKKTALLPIHAVAADLSLIKELPDEITLTCDDKYLHISSEGYYIRYTLLSSDVVAMDFAKVMAATDDLEKVHVVVLNTKDTLKALKTCSIYEQRDKLEAITLTQFSLEGDTVTLENHVKQVSNNHIVLKSETLKESPEVCQFRLQSGIISGVISNFKGTHFELHYHGPKTPIILKDSANLEIGYLQTI